MKLKKNEKIKNFWPKENNSSGNSTKPYIFDKKLKNYPWTVFRLSLLITFFEFIDYINWNHTPNLRA